MLLTSNSICSQFAHNSSKFICSVMSAILDFWQPSCANRGLNSFLSRTLSEHLSTNSEQAKSDEHQISRNFLRVSKRGSHATFSWSVEWNSFRIFSWISLYCVCSNADQGKMNSLSFSRSVLAAFLIQKFFYYKLNSSCAREALELYISKAAKQGKLRLKL